jgi:beta-1,4-mannooligosaccharide/beta-1,4-mannosyl-N-acetylglucosamine phosphorylase
MPTKLLNAIDIPNIPWEDKNISSKDSLWRYSKNPIIPRDLIENSNSIFNSAVVYKDNKYFGVFRCDDKTRKMQLHSGESDDGINWTLSEEPIKFISNDSEIGEFVYGYDPRVCFIEDRYYVTWCNGYHGPTIGVGYTYDFVDFYLVENAFLPFNRNGVLFPRKIDGKYVMLSRPSDNGHTPFGDIFLSKSPDMIHWGEHRYVMGVSEGWQATKIGPGPNPIETDEGWLLIYHGVLNSCNGFVYSAGGAILDLDEPWKVKYRTSPYLISPQKIYECVGDVPNVVFPCSALVDKSTGKLALYYGSADTTVSIAFGYVNEIIDFIKNNSKL